jgi:hemoglobin-like flavoprotein
MSLNVELLEQSFGQIKPQADQFAASFYENLFLVHPEVKPMFAATNMAKQQKLLLASLVLVVENLRKPDVLEKALKNLGAKHVGYGTIPEHYPAVGEAILTTFQQYLSEDWTPEVKQAWTDAFGAISALMLTGAEEANTPPETV